jgi:hypothetical protein
MRHECAAPLRRRRGVWLLILALVAILAGCATATEPTLADIISADAGRPTFLFFYTDG